MREKWMKREQIEMLLENIYLIFMAIFVIYLFLWSTTFEIQWPAHFFDNIYYILTGLILVRMAYGKRYNLFEIFFVGGIYVLLFSAFKRNGYEEYIYVFIMVLGARGISFKKIISVYAAALGAIFICMMGFALSGKIENLTYYQEGRRARYSFGANYPTDFSAHIFYLILSWFYIRGKKLSYIETGLSLVVGIGVYWFCDARLNTICIFLLSGVFAARKFWIHKCEKSGKEYKMNKILAGLLIISPILCGTVMTWLTMLYSSENRLLEFINKALSSRLRLGKKGIDIYGLTLWGQGIELHGLGGTSGEVNNYFFLDSSYLYILLQFGLLVFSILLFIWVCIGIKAYILKDWILLWIIGFIAVQCMVEHHMTDITFVPFWMALAAKLTEKNTEKKEDLHENKVDKRGIQKK